MLIKWFILVVLFAENPDCNYYKGYSKFINEFHVDFNQAVLNSSVTDAFCFDMKLSGELVNPGKVFKNWLDYYGICTKDFVYSFEEIDSVFYLLDRYCSSSPLISYPQYSVYSPDSSMFVNIDNANVFEQGNNDSLIFEGKDIDSEIILFQKSEKKYICLLYLGPDFEINDAEWLKNNVLIILGLNKEKNNYPFIWMFDLNKHKYCKLISTKVSTVDNSNYLGNIRLKELTRHNK